MPAGNTVSLILIAAVVIDSHKAGHHIIVRETAAIHTADRRVVLRAARDENEHIR